MTNEQTLEKKITADTTISSRASFIYCNLITEMQMYSYNKEREKCYEDKNKKKNIKGISPCIFSL